MFFFFFLLQAIRQGKMPESMQLVARVNAEAGGKVSVFDRLASTTTESRRQKVNDRDQLHENLRYHFLIVWKGVCWRRGVSYRMTGCFFRGFVYCVKWQAVCFTAVYCMAGCFSEAKGWMVGLSVLLL